METDAAAARKGVCRMALADRRRSGREIGEALPFPGESIEKDFACSTAHPVVEAYRAYRQMPYDAPSWAMAAMLYAVHPEDGYFKLSDNGTPRNLILDPGQKERILRTYIEMASAKPVARKPRHPADEKKDEKKEEKKDVSRQSRNVLFPAK